MKQVLVKYWRVLATIAVALLGLLFMFQVRRDSKVSGSDTDDSKSVLDLSVDAQAKQADAVTEDIKATNIVLDKVPVPVDPDADLAKLVDTYNKL